MPIWFRHFVTISLMCTTTVSNNLDTTHPYMVNKTLDVSSLPTWDNTPRSPVKAPPETKLKEPSADLSFKLPNKPDLRRLYTPTHRTQRFSSPKHLRYKPWQLRWKTATQYGTHGFSVKLCFAFHNTQIIGIPNSRRSNYSKPMLLYFLPTAWSQLKQHVY